MPSGNTFYMTGIRLTTAPTAGYFLRGDAAGTGTWAAVPPSVYANGSAASPSITFIADGTTGLYLSTGPSTLGFAVAGAPVAAMNAGGLTLTNGLTLSVGTSGTSSGVDVYGPITGFGGLTIAGASSLAALTTSGLSTAAAGLTVSNGQTLNVGTSGTSSPLNVYGISTLNARLLVNAGGADIIGAASTVPTAAGFVVETPTYTTVGTLPVYMNYISGTAINTAGGVPTEAYNLVLANPPTGAAANYNLFVDGGRSYMNTAMRYRVTLLAGPTPTNYNILATDYAIVMTQNGGTKNVILQSTVAIGTQLVFVNVGTGNMVLNPNGTSIAGSTATRNVGAGSTLVIFGATATAWYIL